MIVIAECYYFRISEGRLKRDIGERGRTLESVLAQYNKYVKPSFDYYIAPTMSFADIIVPRGGDNTIAIDLIVSAELLEK